MIPISSQGTEEKPSRRARAGLLEILRALTDRIRSCVPSLWSSITCYATYFTHRCSSVRQKSEGGQAPCSSDHHRPNSTLDPGRFFSSSLDSPSPEPLAALAGSWQKESTIHKTDWFKIHDHMDSYIYMHVFIHLHARKSEPVGRFSPRFLD